MTFNSVHFLVFLPVVFAMHWLLPQKWRWLLLLFASYYFYMSWNPWFGILLAGTTIVDWFAALKIEQTDSARQKKAWLLVSIFSNVGCLAAFKYSAFLYNTFSWTAAEFSGQHPHYIEAFLIPVGLSFYTFQSLSYTIDVYRMHAAAEKNPAMFALYVSFFPQLVAGPVERYGHLAPQFRKPHFLSAENLQDGIRLTLWGYFKKIAIADRLADFVNPVFAHPANYNGLTLLITGFFFVVQVYCDFSGYSDIATGVAQLFGYELRLNWRRPLLSKSLIEFWTRNHISMTGWFRDYVYISLGGNRVKFPRWLLNIFLVFVISGLWHGARWTFVLWGAMHGIVYIIELLLKGKFKAPKFAGWVYLILFHTISLIAFRANSFHDLRIIYHNIFASPWNRFSASQELVSLHDKFPLALALLMIAFLFGKELLEEYPVFKKTKTFGTVWRPAFYILLLVLLFTAGQFSANEFIYFHF